MCTVEDAFGQMCILGIRRVLCFSTKKGPLCELTVAYCKYSVGERGVRSVVFLWPTHHSPAIFVKIACNV